MPGQDAILTLLLQNQQLIGELGNTVQKWVEATRRMDQAADEVTFDAAKREVDSLREKIEALAVTSVKDLARIDAANKEMAKQFGASAANVKKVETAIGRFADKAVKDLNRIQAEADKLNLKKAQDQAKLVGRSYEELEASVRKSFIEARKAADELNLQKARDQAITTAKSYQELEASVRESFIEARKEAEKLSLEKARREAELTKQSIDSLASSAARHFQSMESAAKASGAQIAVGIGGQITALGPNIQRLRAQFDATIAAMRSASDKVTFERLKAQAQTLHAQIQRLGVQASNDIRKIGKAADDTAKPVSNLTSVVGSLQRALGALGIVLSVRSLFNFATDAVQTGIRVQALEAQLSAAAGTQERYNELLQFSHFQSERLGFDFEVLAQSTARFEAATRLAGISESARLNVLRSTIDVARTLQLSNQRLNNTLLALEQLASKGTVSMEELRRQLGDNVPGAVAILASELGVTIHQLFRMIEANEVLSSEALPALARGFDKISEPGLAVALETTATAMGQLRKEVLDIKVAFSEGFSEELKKGIRDTTQSLEEMEPAAFSAGKGVAAFATSLKPLFKDLGDLATAAGEEGLSGQLLVLAGKFVSVSAEETGLIAKTDQTWGKMKEFSLDVAALSEDIEGKLNKSLRDLSSELTKASAAEEGSAVRIRALADASSSLVESVGQAQRAGKLQGDQLLDLVRISGELSDLYGDDLPGNIGRLISSLESLLTVEQRATLAAERHTEAQKAEAEASLDLTEAFAKRSVAADEASRALFGDISVIERHTQATIDAIRNVIGSGEDLTSFTEEQLGAMRDAIQDLLEQWAKVGTEPPKALVFLGEQLEITTEVVEKELEDQSKAAEKAAKEEEQASKRRIQALERIGDAFLKLSQQLGKGGTSDGLANLQKQLDSLRAEEEELTFGIEADPERLQEVQAEIENVREQIRNFTEDQTALGEETAKTANIIDDAIKGLIDQIVPLLGSLNDSQESSVQSILKNLQILGQEGVATGDDVASALQQMVGVFQSAGLPVEELQSALAELQTGTLDIEKAFAAARREFEEGGEALGDVRARIDELKDSNKELLAEVEKGKKLFKEFADAADSELKRAATAYGALLTQQRESVELCAALKNCLAGAG